MDLPFLKWARFKVETQEEKMMALENVFDLMVATGL